MPTDPATSHVNNADVSQDANVHAAINNGANYRDTQFDQTHDTNTDTTKDPSGSIRQIVKSNRKTYYKNVAVSHQNEEDCEEDKIPAGCTGVECKDYTSTVCTDAAECGQIDTSVDAHVTQSVQDYPEQTPDTTCEGCDGSTGYDLNSITKIALVHTKTTCGAEEPGCDSQQPSTPVHDYGTQQPGSPVHDNGTQQPGTPEDCDDEPEYPAPTPVDDYAITTPSPCGSAPEGCQEDSPVDTVVPEAPCDEGCYVTTIYQTICPTAAPAATGVAYPDPKHSTQQPQAAPGAPSAELGEALKKAAAAAAAAKTTGNPENTQNTATQNNKDQSGPLGLNKNSGSSFRAASVLSAIAIVALTYLV